MNNEFIGLDGFIWFYGVVEDRDDPYQIGRVKVRCFGHHTGNKDDLPTEDLPWAQVMLPVTSAGISGIGQTPLGLVEGSHVFGFFRDGEDRQEPVVMGSMPGYPAELADTTKGFYDPNGEYPRYINSPDTNQLSTMDDYSYNPSLTEHASVVSDRTNLKTFENIGTAVVEPMQLASAFISKGSGSIFGLVADIITSAVSGVIGANVLNTVGSTLTGFTETAGDLVDNITDGGKTFLSSNLGLDTTAIEQSTVNFSSTASGKVRAQIISPRLPSADQLLQSGLEQVGTDEIGNFKLDVVDPASMQTLFADAAETELLNNYNTAKARVDSGQGVVEGSVSQVIDPTVLGLRGALGTLETTEAQASELNALNQQLQNTGGSAAQGSLLSVTDKTTGVVTAVVEDIAQDSISQVKTVLGDQGISIPQKSTVTSAGISKLMNNFISADKSSFSMPTIPTTSDTYPKKHVFETESGHVMVYDDNLGNETIMQRHTTGTRYAMLYDGSKIDHVVSDHIVGIEGTSYTNIKEDQIVTLNGRYKIYVNKDETRDNNYDIVVGKNANINIQVDKGDLNINILDGRINANCSDNLNMIIGGDTNIITQGDYTVNAGGEITMQGDKIYLN
jgi:hypothetical protein